MSFKICIIGCGYMSTYGHGPSLNKYAGLNPSVELAACCDIAAATAEDYRKKFGFARSYTDYSIMLDAEKPDAVCLVSPMEYTAKMSIDIIKKGYPLILEKPPGANRFEAMEIINAAEKYGTPNQVAFNRRYIPLMCEMKQRLQESSKLEDIQNIRCDFLRVNRRDDDFYGTAVHAIDAVRYITGSDYDYIRFDYQDMSAFGPGVINIYMSCVFKSGARAQLNFCPVSGSTAESYLINTYNNSFYFSVPIIGGIEPDGKLLHMKEGKTVLEMNSVELSGSGEMYITNGFYDENASFFNDIRAGKRPCVDVKAVYQSVEAADCIRERLGEYRAC